MNDYSASCDGVQVDEEGGLFSLAVYSDGEGFNSFVYYSTDVASRSEPNVQSELLDVQTWLTDIVRREDKVIFCMDADGGVHTRRNAEWIVTAVSSQGLTCGWLAPTGSLYVGGDEGVVYCFDGGDWSAISPPLGNTIFSIRGTSSNDLYVCGEGALFWHFDGQVWSQIALPTNQRLLGILALSPKDVFVCGRGGMLYRGSGEAWSDTSHPGHHFHSIAEFQSKLYLAGAGEGVFCLEEGQLTNIKDSITSYKLTANKQYLASSGDGVAARFDGAEWFGTRFS
jgi:hypothetical protein